jgi:predicted enzyme related to lactoylglutathione lyase
MTTGTPTFVGFSHCMLFAKNLDGAVAWYCSTLGFSVDYHAQGEYASLAHPQLGRLALHATDSDEQIGKGPMPYFLVEDLDAAIAALRAQGAAVGEPQQEGESPRFTDLRDCEGNVLGLEEV